MQVQLNLYQIAVLNQDESTAMIIYQSQAINWQPDFNLWTLLPQTDKQKLQQLAHKPGTTEFIELTLPLAPEGLPARLSLVAFSFADKILVVLCEPFSTPSQRTEESDRHIANIHAILQDLRAAPPVEASKTALYDELIKTNNEMLNLQRDLAKKNAELTTALEKVKLLSGLIPICANCKKIRDDQGYWEQVEQYITKHSLAVFSHTICPDCMQKLYPDYFQKPKTKPTE